MRDDDDMSGNDIPIEPDEGTGPSQPPNEVPDPFDALAGFELLLPEIPRELQSCFKEDLFRICIECGTDLLESGRAYLIQKARRDGETLLELAICQSCASQVQGKVSEESRAVLEDFVERIGARAGTLPSGYCLACRTEVPPEAEFEIAALARGRHLMAPPLVICGACHEELEENLSEETKKGGQDFIEKNFPGVPADLGLPFSLVGA